MNQKIEEKINELNFLLMQENERNKVNSKVVVVVGAPGENTSVAVFQDGILQETSLTIMMTARHAAEDARVSTTSHLKPVIRPRFSSRPPGECITSGGD